mmetsp:Transcript_2594/g.4009  ORF Transcript_2594/g.4009 Transcript_2594/m.4009 type:complete len:357 (+) Transcript_2594:2-1072(+)
MNQTYCCQTYFEDLISGGRLNNNDACECGYRVLFHRRAGILRLAWRRIFGSSAPFVPSASSELTSNIVIILNRFETNVVTKFETLESKFDTLESKVDTKFAILETKVDVALQSIAPLVLGNTDVYANLTQTSNSKKLDRQELQDDLRRRLYERHGIQYQYRQNQISCFLTGRRGICKIAHLLPVSASETSINRVLNLSNDQNGIWSLRNVLYLSYNVEMAFDRKRLSFIEHPTRMDTFILKIWDDSVRKELIWSGAEMETVEGDQYIGFYEGRSLNLTLANGVQWAPFKRCLAYQLYICAASRMLADEMPSDFSSEECVDWRSKRAQLLVLKKSLEKTVAVEVDEAEEDNEKEDLY